MKHLFVALICSVIGFGAYANDITPEKSLPAVAKIEIKATKGEQKITENKNKKSNFFRRQMSFQFHDMCGNVMTVWVSGPSSASDYDLWHTGLEYSSSQLSWGCYK